MLRLEGDRTVKSVAFSPCGQFLAAAGFRHVCVWTIATGEGHDVEPAPASFAGSVAYSPDGGHITWTSDNGLMTCPVQNGVPTNPVRLLCGGVTTAGFLRSGRWVGIKGNSPVTGDLGRKVIQKDGVFTGPLAFSPRLPLFAAGVHTTRRRESQVAVYDEAFRRTAVLTTSPPESLAISPDGTQVAATNKGLEVRDVESGAALFQAADIRYTVAAFTPDGRRLLAGGLDQEVRVWDTATWSEVRRLNWEASWIDDLAVAPDGLTAAAAGWSGQIVIWDLDE